TATLGNNNASDVQPVTFVADKDSAVVVLQTSKAEIIGNGVDETTLTATVKDPSNHPVAGITVNFTMPQDVAANFTLENNGLAITQAKGEAHVTLKGKKEGTHTVPATLA
ncbi:Ig-like domain-containing protein, partial [Escherichia coli]|nr:Ig-like domain-containing protein [Escherichia coli]